MLENKKFASIIIAKRAPVWRGNAEKQDCFAPLALLPRRVVGKARGFLFGRKARIMTKQGLQRFGLFTLVMLFAAASVAVAADAVYMANGVKIGEARQDSVILWTRLTEAPERNADGVPFPDVDGGRNSGADLSIETLTGGNPVAAMELSLIHISEPTRPY